MYREKTLIKFRRYFLHSIRDGKNAEDAADAAMWKTRSEILKDLAEDDNVPDKATKEAMWNACLELLTIVRVVFVDYDYIYEERKRQADQNKKLLEADEAPPRPASMSDAVISGLEQRVDEDQRQRSKDGT
jgi:hypothetical protein